MAQKAIHHLGRGLTIALEALCFLAVIALIAWGALLWRLSQGPLDASFLAGQIESAFMRRHEGMTFHAGSMLLTWGGRLEPFEIEMRDVHVKRADDTPVLDIGRIGIQLSKRRLIFGDIAPKVIKVYDPSLRVIRWEDGRVTLNMEERDDVPPEAEPEAEPAATQTQTELIRSFLTELEDDNGFGFLNSLREISVSGAELSYEDKVLNVSWQSRRADIALERQSDGLSAEGSFAIDMGEGGTAAVIRADATYNWDTGGTEGNLSFSGVVPARLGQQSERLKDLSGVDLPLRGSIDFTLARDLSPGRLRFVFGADPGTFNALDFYKEPLAIRNIYLAGAADMAAGTGAISEFKIELGAADSDPKKNPVINATGKMRTESGQRVLTVQAELLNTRMDDLGKYWPETLTPDPRHWVTTYLTKGIADKATLDLELAYDAAAAEEKVSLRKVGGIIDFHGMKVDYFDPLPPVTEGRGRATYDHKSFNIAISGGKLEDMTVTKSAVRITDLDIQDEVHNAHIDIDVSLQGPLRTAMKVLDSKPLEYPQQLGIKTADVAGNAAVDVNFKFPLHKALEIDDVDINAKAKLDGVRLGDMVSGLPLSGGPMELSVDGGALKVWGTGQLGDMPLTFDWTKNFDEKTEPSNKLTAKLPLTPAGLAAFGVPKDLAVTGRMPADIDYTLSHKGRGVLKLSGDITPAGITLPVVAYRKEEGKPGSLAMTVTLQDDKLSGISGLDLKAEGLAFKGDVSFDAAGNLSKATLGDVTFGASNISVEASGLGAAGYQVKITGKQIDASEFFKEEEGAPKKTLAQKEAEAAEKVTPLKVNLAVDRLLTGSAKGLENVRLFMQRNAWQRIDQLELNAAAGRAPLSVRYLPAGKGHSLNLEAGNAGAALGAFGIVKSIQGGKLSVNGRTGANDSPRDLRGTAVLTDFTLKDAPVIAKLLNAMSLPGILSLLSGQGITFKKARVNFVWQDRGPPTHDKNVRMIRLSDGKTSGASLGLTFEGDIDNWRDVYDLNGTIIPVSDINKILNMIPIIGNVLTAGGEGIIAATYTIKGPTEDPTVMVNPLSVLAPGILRKIFFEN